MAAMLSEIVADTSLWQQLLYMTPALTVSGIAASVALRRCGYGKSGLLIQLMGPILFVIAVMTVSDVEKTHPIPPKQEKTALQNEKSVNSFGNWPIFGCLNVWYWLRQAYRGKRGHQGRMRTRFAFRFAE